MRLKVYVGEILSAFFFVKDGRYVISYSSADVPPISKALPVREPSYYFDTFPSQFEVFLPKAWHLEALGLQMDENKMVMLSLIGQELPGNLSFRKDDES